MKVDRAFKKLADSLPLMMAYVDNQGRYQHVNQAYRNFVGLELHQVKGKFISEIIGAESYQQITRCIISAFLPVKKSVLPTR